MDRNKPNKPDTVRHAVTLLYFTLAIGIFRSVLEPLSSSQEVFLSFEVFILVFVLAFMWLFIFLIGKGKNWARVTFLVLFIIGLPFSVLPLLLSLVAAPISGLLGITQTVLQAVALIMLFQKPSSIWFHYNGINHPDLLP